MKKIESGIFPLLREGELTMKRDLIFFFVLIVSVFISVVAIAQSTQTQEQVELVSIPKSMLTKEQVAQIEMMSFEKKVQLYGKWVGLGKEVGQAVDGALSALTDQTAKFSQTRVGVFTMFLVAWKVVGREFLHFLVGGIFLFIGVPIWIWSYRKSCVPRRYLSEETKDGIKKYEMRDIDGNSMIVHVVAVVILILISLITIFS